MSAIRSIKARLFNVPLAEVLADAKHGDHSHFELVTAEIRLESGLSGTGYTYTGGRGGHSIKAMISRDLAPFLTGRGSRDAEALNEAMQWHMHYTGRGGIVSFAISALDIALWDLRGKMRGQPLSVMAGGAAKSCKAYRGGIDLGFSLDKLLRSVSASLASGFNGVKIKCGKPDLGEDIRRLAAVREMIGPDITLMADANYAFGVEQAVAAARAFRPFNLLWLEEPVIPEDLRGYARIAEETGMPLAMGENLRTPWEFSAALSEAKLSFIQPDASNCCGITGWLAAAKLARPLGVSVCSHGMQELHVSLLAGLPDSGWLEAHSFPIDQYATRPLRLQNTLALAPDVPGTGVEFDWEKLSPFEA